MKNWTCARCGRPNDTLDVKCSGCGKIRWAQFGLNMKQSIELANRADRSVDNDGTFKTK